jgi:hypothetical protein
MNLFSVGLKDQPGELARLGEVCARRGVNLQLAGMVTGERGHSPTRLSARSRCVPSVCALVAVKGGT